MKQWMMNILAAISLLLVVDGVLTAGVFFFDTLMDLIGYAIYLSVFAVPAAYYYKKSKAA